MTSGRHVALYLCCLTVAGQLAAQQRVPEPKATAKGTLVLPVPTSPDLFGDITETIGQFDMAVQLPVFKGLGVGIGGQGSFFTLNNRTLGAIHGDAIRWCYYGKVQYERYTGPRTYYELSARAGQTILDWNASTCAEVQRQYAFHWGAQAAYYLHASDNLAFGLMLGYASDQLDLYPELLCVETWPGRAEIAPIGPLRFLSVGLGFSTRFTRAPDIPVNYE